MLLVVPHSNIPLATTTQCCLFWCDCQPWLILPLLTWLLHMSGPPVNICPPQSLVLPLMGMIHRLAEILGRMMKCRLCGPKWAVGFGALAMFLRASFALHQNQE